MLRAESLDEAVADENEGGRGDEDSDAAEVVVWWS